MSKLDGIKTGDEVEITFRGVFDGTKGGDLSVKVGRGFSVRFWAYEVAKDDFQITRIEPEFEVGDLVKYLASGGKCTVIAFLADGRLVIEYESGDTTEVIARDPSCFTRA